MYLHYFIFDEKGKRWYRQKIVEDPPLSAVCRPTVSDFYTFQDSLSAPIWLLRDETRWDFIKTQRGQPANRTSILCITGEADS